MELIANQYQVQNLSLLDIAQQFGTPLYVYDAAKIVQKIEELKQAFAQVNLKIKFAGKALTNVSVLKVMRQNGVELDVVSPQELQLGLLAGYEGSQITFTPSGVSFDEIETAVAAGSMVNLDNLSVLEKFGQRYGSSVPCMIRIKPNVAAGGNAKIMTAHDSSKFGIDVRQKAEILQLVEQYQINVVGLHQHTGSDIKTPEAFVQVANIIFEFAHSFKGLKYIDLGGGFKVSYKKDDVVTNMAEVGKELSNAFRAFCQSYGAQLQLWFEPGKFLVSECGYFLTTANVVKHNPTRTFVGINSGLNHLIRPMMYDGAYHEIVNISNPNTTEEETYDVVGYICETDTFGTDRTLKKVREGDVLAFKNAGAYGFTMSSQYNSRFRPAEVLVYQGKAHLIRQRETMEDILRNQVLTEFL
ncbi:MAG: diaminopimelate decarboxylase [Cytophagia bacterium]|nr:MAG: diaminopimelate decarboxylase [Runella sp.]TAG24419.1 MAG: diaminopimelate decarboxylase [Cytophagales bacterium]TAG35235.1 MAG: diaminopimelate decarboxylase [Cytophagia bacterium]TAG58595.1 MAG: diaminopimelate decarboxylase [Runella slithyformis]TAG66374.1 MAG: diaminopimelate decarboxylase [Runella slithyformis]